MLRHNQRSHFDHTIPPSSDLLTRSHTAPAVSAGLLVLLCTSDDVPGPWSSTCLPASRHRDGAAAHQSVSTSAKFVNSKATTATHYGIAPASQSPSTAKFLRAAVTGTVRLTSTLHMGCYLDIATDAFERLE